MKIELINIWHEEYSKSGGIAIGAFYFKKTKFAIFSVYGCWYESPTLARYYGVEILGITFMHYTYLSEHLRS